jgi:predicted nuclease of restriction endonuclease-like (RecB) superfamily
MTFKLNNDYIELLKSLKDRIRQARLRATVLVNNELLQLYWEIGNTILIQQKKEGWGTKVVDRMVSDLKFEFPDMKGLSSRNVKYMRAFADAYPDFIIVQGQPAQSQIDSENKIVQAALAQLSWYHHTTL